MKSSNPSPYTSLNLIRRWFSDDDRGTDGNLGFDEHPNFPRLGLGIRTRMFYALDTGS